MVEEKKKILLAPLDPVHDVGLKMIRRALDEAGYETNLLPPDLPPEEIVKNMIAYKPDYTLIGRTLGYDVETVLSRLVDLADASGLRPKMKMVVGGMPIKPELAAELGFDAGFGPGTTPEEVVAYIEGRLEAEQHTKVLRQKPKIAEGFSYRFVNEEIGRLCSEIADEALAWASERTSPGIERSQIRREMFSLQRRGDSAGVEKLRREYAALCDSFIKPFYDLGQTVGKTRLLSESELAALNEYAAEAASRLVPRRVRHSKERPLVFTQYGTGCPFMDVAHIKVVEAWGADGVIHFDPSWGARHEGLLEGHITHEEDGSPITPENLALIKHSLMPWTLWQVRAHRGLNTPETVVLAGEMKADLTKVNMVYGSLGAGTDPERLVVDGTEALRLAAEYGLPYDVVTNEELCGVPAYKAFAGMLIVATMGIKLGGRPILKPLFCYSPEVLINGQMSDNYVDFNAAKLMALRSIIDAPVWPGEPVGFMTHTSDRIQASATTMLHACLASSLDAVAVTISSSDEAFSGGPISAASRVDTLRAVTEGMRFFGKAKIQPTEKAEEFARGITEGIQKVLQQVKARGSFVSALYEGLLGNKEDGVYPGRAGRQTVRTRST
ncbi:MAG TPA: cobalamin B12-binding domain-containing protein [Firmicutes bacterium]|nr:cobalamin B12-binding domain-containing protein [Bacillota bacterium]